MVSAALSAPGIRFSASDLMLLRNEPFFPQKHSPAARRPGIISSAPPGTGMDLREIRSFSEGDDTRRIDLAATARTGSLHVRCFHEDRDDSILLIADFRPAMLWGTGTTLRSVRAARILARWGWQATARGASIAAISTYSGGIMTLSPGNGIQHMCDIAHMLSKQHDQALSGSKTVPSMTETFMRAMRIAPAGTEVLIATSAEGIAAIDETGLAQLARRRKVKLLLPLDPVETAPPSSVLPISSGGLGKLARLCPADTSTLRARLTALNVSLELISHDAG